MGLLLSHLKRCKGSWGKLFHLPWHSPARRFPYVRWQPRLVQHHQLGRWEWPALSEEIASWRFLDSWTGHVPRRMEKQVAVTISTDTSQLRWQPTVLGDFWEDHVASEGVNVQEIWVVAKVLEALANDIHYCWVNFQVDNQVVRHTWMGRGGRGKNIYPVAKRISHLTQEWNLQSTMIYVPFLAVPRSCIVPAVYPPRSHSHTPAMQAGSFYICFQTVG